MAEVTPLTYEEALSGPESAQWKRAIDDELQSHKDDATSELVPKKDNMKLIDSKWVFTILRDEEGNAVRFKARLCARGFRQIEGVDYQETFASVIRYGTFRIFLAFVTEFDLEMFEGYVNY